MNRTLTVSAFKKYVEKNTPSKIVLDSSNQKWDYAPLQFHLSFSKIDVYNIPPSVYLTGDVQNLGCICLQCVDRIRISKKDIYTAATVFCKIGESDVRFRLLLFR